MKYLAKTKNNVFKQNTRIAKKDYSSISIINIGDDDAVINDNIPLKPGDAWEFKNKPYVQIDEDTTVEFAGVEVNKKVLVEMTFYKEVNNAVPKRR